MKYCKDWGAVGALHCDTLDELLCVYYNRFN